MVLSLFAGLGGTACAAGYTSEHQAATYDGTETVKTYKLGENITEVVLLGEASSTSNDCFGGTRLTVGSYTNDTSYCVGADTNKFEGWFLKGEKWPLHQRRAGQCCG